MHSYKHKSTPVLSLTQESISANSLIWNWDNDLEPLLLKWRNCMCVGGYVYKEKSNINALHDVAKHSWWINMHVLQHIWIHKYDMDYNLMHKTRCSLIQGV